MSVTEAELARQRFAFTISATSVDEGRVRTVLDPGTAVAGILVVGGALALGIVIGGGRLPRCDPDASRIVLRTGGVAALALGIVIGIDRLAGL